MKKQIIRNQASKMMELADSIMIDYKSENYEVQKLEVQGGDNASGSLIVQIRNTNDGVGGFFKKVIGCENCASLILTPIGDDLEIKVTGGKWLDKVVVAGISIIVLWPLLITATVGSVRQKALLDKLFMRAIGKLASNEV